MHVNIKKFVRVFSGSVEARILKLCIFMDNDLLYLGGGGGGGGLKMRLIALILPFICPFFSLFKAKFVSQFSQELCKLQSTNMVYIYVE